MSRGLDDSRHEVGARTGPDAERSVDGRPMVRVARTWPEATLALPRETERRVVRGRDREYLLDDRETRALATVGAFRVVSREDLDADDHLRCATTERLEDLGLLRHETLADEHELARRLRFQRDRGFVRRLHASHLCRTLGQDDNRNRHQTRRKAHVVPASCPHDVTFWPALGRALPRRVPTGTRTLDRARSGRE
jgi:hypothetical protein